MAQIGWIDFSPKHRERVAAVLDFFTPEGVVDELGIGNIRDAFADTMFPGINTIQTRAKYFFLIPYILFEYQQLSAAKRRSIKPEKYLEEREYEVMWELAERYEHKEDGNGVIGISKRKPDKIMRRPSAIYWNGLAVFGMVKSNGLGVDTFLRSHNKHDETLLSEVLQGDDAPRDDGEVDYSNIFNLGIPFDSKWDVDLNMDLKRGEATLLYDRIRDSGRDILVGKLLEDGALFKMFCSSVNFADFARTSVSEKSLGKDISETVTMAHDFSELMYGAHLAYNCILQKMKYGSDVFSDKWNAWIDNLRTEMIDYEHFDPDVVLEIAHRVKDHTRLFVREWWDFVTSSRSVKKRDELIEAQEYMTKTGKARIRRNNFEDVKEGSWIGLTKLEYRMRNVKRILQDVVDGRSS